ncbi:MAG: hypothetical protein IPP46_12525 [Bacteroidetes bacterium]|nr:hypothetical protein [Bacteroidota bacterium]
MSQSQGFSVSISADGSTAIVGGSADNGSIGAAWVWKRNGSSWAQQGNKLIGTGNSGISYQGTSVDLSADASTVIIGGRGIIHYRVLHGFLFHYLLQLLQQLPRTVVQ